MYLALPTDPTSLYYEQTVPLEGVEYLFTSYWSDRESAWYLSLADQDASPIGQWIRIVVCANRPPSLGTMNLLRRFVDPRLPPGLLFCTDLTGQEREIEQPTDLGTRCPLIYVTSDDPSIAGKNLRL